MTNWVRVGASLLDLRGGYQLISQLVELLIRITSNVMALTCSRKLLTVIKKRKTVMIVIWLLTDLYRRN